MRTELSITTTGNRTQVMCYVSVMKLVSNTSLTALRLDHCRYKRNVVVLAMVGCVAFSCRNRSDGKLPGLTFHRFPVDPKRKMSWVRNMKIEDWTPLPNDRLCSAHFEDECFYRTASKRLLRSGAIPTVFANVPVSQSANKSIKRPPIEEVLIVVSDTEVEPDLPDDTKLKNKLLRVQHLSGQKTKKIRVLNQSLKRCKRRVRLLKQIVKCLETENLKSAENAGLLNNMTEINKILLKRKQNSKTTYTPELRKFAVTLKRMSPKAYDYVRNTFNMSLPHASTIGKWFQTVKADPGGAQASEGGEIDECGQRGASDEGEKGASDEGEMDASEGAEMGASEEFAPINKELMISNIE